MSPSTARGQWAPFYWERRRSDTRPVHDGAGPDALRGADLSAMRRGLGRPPGDVPAMWPLYTRLAASGEVTVHLRAEHVSLGLFGLHQQSQRVPMHQPGVSLGQAMAALRNSGRYSSAAVDARFSQAATAPEIDELAMHLRGLISQLKTLRPPQGLDYTQLFWDLVRWQHPEHVARIRRAWGARYFRPDSPRQESAEDST